MSKVECNNCNKRVEPKDINAMLMRRKEGDWQGTTCIHCVNVWDPPSYIKDTWLILKDKERVYHSR